MLVHDVFKAFPSEWDEVLPLVEFIRMNSPTSQTGMTPRDVDRRWSLASPIERELLAADLGGPVAVSELLRQHMDDWKSVRQLVLQRMGREGRRRAALANRFRRPRQLAEGQSVLVKDPKLTKERAGRTPWRRPLSTFGQITGVNGKKVDIRG